MKPFSTSKRQEKAILVGVATSQQKKGKAEEYLDELSFLALTAGARVIKRFIQNLPHANPRTFIGEGKLGEISRFVKEQEIDIVIFDDELTPSQIRNIEREINPANAPATCKILDRSNLILDIFAGRARSAQAKIQVELAQAEYLLPRLTRMWTHLSKQKGGVGMKGPGETEIETDRRALRNKITKLKEKLDVIDRQSMTRRQHRHDKVRIALVGYTNVGKSTVMNLLAKSNVVAEDKLFATLDATVRKTMFGDQICLLTDTVGFIRKLPHQLIECFKSTLDEVREAEILVHVVDISHPNFEEQIMVVNQTLEELKARNKPTILVFNKIDLMQPPAPNYEEEENNTPYEEQLKSTWMGRENAPVIFISAAKKINISELRAEITQATKNLLLTSTSL